MNTHLPKSQKNNLALSQIKLALEAEGLELSGLTTFAPVSPSSLKRLDDWRNRGFSANLEYMQRDLTSFSDPFACYPNLRYIVTFTLKYSTTPRAPLFVGQGLIARYAWGRDYHGLIRKAAKRVLRRLSESTGQKITGVLAADSIPILERHLAAVSGGGGFGKNSMLIRPGEGSFFILGELFLSCDVTKDCAVTLAPSVDCKECTRCVDRCPTRAIVEPGLIDARRCISYLTIEHKKLFSEDEIRALGSWLFGCDICQEVCPFNHQSMKFGKINRYLTPKAELAGGVLSLETLMELNESQFFDQFSGSPLMRAGRDRMIRNACAVAINSNYTGVINRLKKLLVDDTSEYVRAVARQALGLL